MEAIISHWKENIRKNSKIISAILGDIIVTFSIVLLYILNSGLDWGVFFFMLTMSVKPFIIVYVNLIMKAEITDIKEEYLIAKQEIILLKQESEKNVALLEQRIEFLKENGILIQDKKQLLKELGYERELSQYKVLVAAKDGKVPNSVIANKDWNEANETIGELEKTE